MGSWGPNDRLLNIFVAIAESNIFSRFRRFYKFCLFYSILLIISFFLRSFWSLKICWWLSILRPCNSLIILYFSDKFLEGIYVKTFKLRKYLTIFQNRKEIFKCLLLGSSRFFNATLTEISIDPYFDNAKSS